MIYVLQGKIETGKTTALLKWIKNRNDCHGILSPGHSPGERHFLNVFTRKKFRMVADPREKDVIEVGRFRFLNSAFKRANTILTRACAISEGTIIIDELGKLELSGEGLHESALKVLQKEAENNEINVVLVVRTSLAESIIAKYNIQKYSVITKEEVQDMLLDCNNSYTTKY